MLKITFPNFGARGAGESGQAAAVLDQRPLSINGPCYGLRIASDSEIDQCRVNELSVVPWENQSTIGDAGQTILGSHAIANDSHILSVERPLVANLSGRNDLILSPTRIQRPKSDFTSAARAASLGIEVLNDPAEAMWLPTKRAPLCVDMTILVDAGGATVLVPMFGRKYWSVEIDSLIVSGAGVVDTMGRANRTMWYATGPTTQTRQWTLWTTTAGDTEKEGEGEFDWLELVVSLSSGTSAAAMIHVRAED